MKNETQKLEKQLYKVLKKHERKFNSISRSFFKNMKKIHGKHPIKKDITLKDHVYNYLSKPTKKMLHYLYNVEIIGGMRQ